MCDAGIEAFRAAKSGNALPNARKVSFTIHDDTDDPSSVYTLLMMLFGQFTDHDLSRTAISKLSVDENGAGPFFSQSVERLVMIQSFISCVCLDAKYKEKIPGYQNLTAVLFV